MTIEQLTPDRTTLLPGAMDTKNGEPLEKIPKQLRNQDLRFCKVRYEGMKHSTRVIDPATEAEVWEEAKAGGKEPFPAGWNRPDKVYKYNDPALLEWIDKGYPYGIVCGCGDLVVVDIDKDYLIEEVEDKIARPTFSVKTGSGKLHLYYYTNGTKSKKILNVNRDTLIDLQANGKMALAPGSPYPGGGSYQVESDVAIAFIDYAELAEKLDYFHFKKPESETKAQTSNNGDISPLAEKINETVTMPVVLQHYGVNIKKNPTNCPMGHDSKRNKCLSFDDSVAHCFHCQEDGEGWNIWSFVKQKEEYQTKQEVLLKLVEIGGIEVAEKKGSPDRTTEKRALASTLYDHQPFFYDRSRIWWLWDKKDHCWKMVDETDIMIEFDRYFTRDTERSQKKACYLEALRKQGRQRIPEPAPDTWIQFKDRIVDVETGKDFKPSSDYFITNRIPWELGDTEDTPTIDKLFAEWVVGNGQDETYVQTLYQIAAFLLLPYYPIHRIFCFKGTGSNGKTTCIRLLERFVGKDNYTSTDIDILATNRFESSCLYRRLLCTIGEIDTGIFKKTSLLKRITGEDDIRIEFKGKQLINTKNYAKVLIATNALPETADKSDGFYRRWLIVDFPNHFDEKERLIDKIPEAEFRNLARKSIRILRDLLRAGKFTNDGGIALRKQRYEERSNVLDQFIQEFCEEDLNEYLPFGSFYNEFRNYTAIHNHKRQSEIEVSKGLTARGHKTEQRTINGVNAKWIPGLNWKEGLQAEVD